MSRLGRLLLASVSAALAFVVDFLIGDDPKVAALVLAVLVAGGVVLLAGAPPALVAVGVVLLLATGFGALVLWEARRSYGP